MNKNDKHICSQMELLRNAAECGIINLDSVLDMYMSNKREQVKKIHPYAMTPPTADGDRWQTCYKDEKGKRKNIKAQTQEELPSNVTSNIIRNILKLHACTTRR